MYADCGYGDRAGATYVSNLYNAISSQFSLGFKYTDDNAWEKDITVSQYMNGVDLFAFSGHGLNGSGGNAMHFYVKNNIEAYHNGMIQAEEWDDRVNAYTFETRFGHDKMHLLRLPSITSLKEN